MLLKNYQNSAFVGLLYIKYTIFLRLCNAKDVDMKLLRL
jgi:hypothetical protein